MPRDGVTNDCTPGAGTIGIYVRIGKRLGEMRKGQVDQIKNEKNLKGEVGEEL